MYKRQPQPTKGCRATIDDDDDDDDRIVYDNSDRFYIRQMINQMFQGAPYEHEISLYIEILADIYGTMKISDQTNEIFV